MVLSLGPRGFSRGNPVSPPKSSKKLKLTNSSSVCNAWTRLSEFLPILKCFVGKQITITVTVGVGAGVRSLE